MGFYYYSACHDCKIKTMWAKCPSETALVWHERFKKEHENHDTGVSHDYDDEFYDRIWQYKEIQGKRFEDMDE